MRGYDARLDGKQRCGDIDLHLQFAEGNQEAYVTTFYFQTLDGDGGLTDTKADLDSLEAAILEARTTLAAIAADGLPKGTSNMLSIEIFDNHRKPLHEIRLLIEEIDKSIRGSGVPSR